MTIYIDPQTKQRHIIDEHTKDIIYNKRCAPSSITEESVHVIGAWQDYTGSRKISSRRLSIPISANLLQGTEAGINGAKLPSLNEDGTNKSFYRRRVKKVWKKLD